MQLNTFLKTSSTKIFNCGAKNDAEPTPVKLGWFLGVPTQQLRPDQGKKQNRFSDPTWPLTKNSWQNKEVSVLAPRPWIPLCGPARAPGCRHEVLYLCKRTPKNCCFCWRTKVDVPRRRYCELQWQQRRVGFVRSLNSCFVSDNGAWQHQKAPFREKITCQRLSPEVWQELPS